MKGIDIGCGGNKHEGCIGLDSNGSFQDVDVVHEIQKYSVLPFEDDTFAEIYLHDILEHLDDIPWALSEVHRIGTPNARVEVRYPHYSGRNAYSDVTHKHFLGLKSLNHFAPNTKEGKKYSYFSFFERNFPFKIESMETKFKVGVISPSLFKLFGENFYEGYISKIFPISDVSLEMRILKP